VVAYSATEAGKAYRTRRLRSVRRRLLIEGGELSQFVRDHLMLYRWSPQQIAAKLRDMHPDDSSQRVSHETIYASIYAYPRGGLKKELVEALRQSKPTRGLRRTTAAKRTWVARQLRASVVGQTGTHGFGQLLQLATEALQYRFSCASVHLAKDHKTRLSFDQFPYAGAVESPLDQVAFPVARNQSLLYVLRAMHDTQLLRYPELMDSNENTNGLLRQFLPKASICRARARNISTTLRCS